MKKYDEKELRQRSWLERCHLVELFGVAPSTIWRWLQEGLLTADKHLGKHVRFNTTKVFALLDSFRKANGS